MFIDYYHQRFSPSPSGREVTWHQCDAMDNSSQIAAQLQDEDRNSSLVKYGACDITVSQNNFSDADQRYSCFNGYRYDFRKDLSFRTEVRMREDIGTN